MDGPGQSSRGYLNKSSKLNACMTQGDRNRIIDEFIQDFSTWDWLYLRARARHVSIDRQHLASVADLPADVLSLVAAYLLLPDIIRCQSVSRKWKATWSDAAVLGGVCENYYPGALRFYEHKIPVDQLLPHLRHLSKHPAGKDWNASAITWNIGPEASSSASRNGVVSEKLPSGTDASPPQLMYAAGKVAWQSEPSFAVVDDLEKRTWRRISFLAHRLRGATTKLVAFSGDLLVVGNEDNGAVDHGNRSSCRKIIVHDMSSDSQKSLTLPSNLTRCVAQSNRMICFTREPQAFYFTWGGSLTELDMTIDEDLEAGPYERRIEDTVLFHPTDPDTLFLVSILSRGAEQSSTRRVSRRGRVNVAHCSIVVTKFHQGNVVNQKRKLVEHMRSTPSIYTANQRGAYALCFSYTRTTLSPGGRLIMYNTVTEDFSEASFSYHIRGMMLHQTYENVHRQPILHFWNNHALLYYRKDVVASEGATNDATAGQRAIKASITLEATSFSRQDSRREPATDVLYQGSPFRTLSQQGRLLGMLKKLHVSDEFVIMSSEHGYVVLSPKAGEISLRQHDANEDSEHDAAD